MNKARTLAIGAILAMAQQVHATTATEHLQELARLRDLAEQAQVQDPGAGGHRQAIDRLLAAVAYHGRADVRDQATGNAYLYMKGVDLYMDLAVQYAALGRGEEALAALEQLPKYVQSPLLAEGLLQQPGLAALRESPRFKAVVAALVAGGRAQGDGAIATPWRERLPAAERVAGLSLFWAEARQGFAWFDHVPALDWNRTYLEFLPKVMAADTTAQYYRVMMQLAALLQDGHTNVAPPVQLSRQMFSSPPMVTEPVEDRVIVRAVRSALLRRQVRVGDEITAIDGVPVREYAERNVAPYVSSSTPQDRQLRMYGYQLLAGDASRPLTLRLGDASGAEREVTISRADYPDTEASSPVEFRLLPGNIAYLAVHHFESDDGVKALDAALPRIMAAAGLVIDVRRNGGGSSAPGYKVLSYLTRSPLPSLRSYVRAATANMRPTRADVIGWQPLPDSPPTLQPRQRVYEGPVAVLAGPATFSAAEDFLATWQLMGRGPTVGMRTGGSTGQPLSFGLPGGGTARICTKRDTYADGSTFVGKGIAPTIEVPETVAAIRAGRDVQLARAVAALQAAGTQRQAPPAHVIAPAQTHGAAAEGP